MVAFSSHEPEPPSIDDAFKALSDESRRRLLDRLNDRNGQTLQELCDGMAMTRQSVSKHLAILETANLVSTARRGREKLHFLNPEPINAIADRWMTRYDRARAKALADLKSALESPKVETGFVYVTYIRTTPDDLWNALTKPEFTQRYWGASLTSDWNAGSPVTWEFAGVVMKDDQQVVLASDPPNRLSYTWHTLTSEFIAAVGGDDHEWLDRAAKEPRSKVTFELEPMGNLVKLTVTHDGFAPGSAVLEGVSGGWPQIMASLKSLLETGEPLGL